MNNDFLIKLKKNKINMEKFYTAFKFPFYCLPGNDGYDIRYNYSDICIAMFNEKLKSEKIDMNDVVFPRDIMKVYWYQEGINDEQPWYFVGKIKCNNKYKYIFYIGECDYTGFECQGIMKMYISKSFTPLHI